MNKRNHKMQRRPNTNVDHETNWWRKVECAGLKYCWLIIPDHRQMSMTGVWMRAPPRGGTQWKRGKNTATLLDHDTKSPSSWGWSTHVAPEPWEVSLTALNFLWYSSIFLISAWIMVFLFVKLNFSRLLEACDAQTLSSCTGCSNKVGF